MTGVTSCTTDLIDFKQYRIIVTVDANFFNDLKMAGCFAFDPEFISGSTVIGGFTGCKGGFPCLSVHKCEHQDLTSFKVLNDGRHQPVEFIEIEFYRIHILSCQLSMMKNVVFLTSWVIIIEFTEWNVTFMMLRICAPCLQFFYEIIEIAKN